MLSAKGEIFDNKLLGLVGADDYMIKPFDSKELVARSRRYCALIRILRHLPHQNRRPLNAWNTGSDRQPDQLRRHLPAVIAVEMPPKELDFCISWLPLQTRSSQSSS